MKKSLFYLVLSEKGILLGDFFTEKANRRRQELLADVLSFELQIHIASYVRNLVLKGFFAKRC